MESNLWKIVVFTWKSIKKFIVIFEHLVHIPFTGDTIFKPVYTIKVKIKLQNFSLY